MEVSGGTGAGDRKEVTALTDGVKHGGTEAGLALQSVTSNWSNQFHCPKVFSGLGFLAKGTRLLQTNHSVWQKKYHCGSMPIFMACVVPSPQNPVAFDSKVNQHLLALEVSQVQKPTWIRVQAVSS